MTQSEFPLSGAISPLPDDIFYSVIKSIQYVRHLYGKVAFVEALLYAGRSSMEIQHALCTKTVTPFVKYFLTFKIDSLSFNLSISIKGYLLLLFLLQILMEIMFLCTLLEKYRCFAVN